MISDEETLRIARKFEDAGNIDIKKTIEKAATAGYLGEKHFYCTVLEDGGMTHTVPEILGDMYKSQPLDNLYFDIISKALDIDGIYISLAYCTSQLNVPNEDCSEIIEYDDYDLDEDEYEYLVEYALITSDEVKKFIVFAEEGIASPNRTKSKIAETKKSPRRSFLFWTKGERTVSKSFWAPLTKSGETRTKTSKPVKAALYIFLASKKKFM